MKKYKISFEVLNLNLDDINIYKKYLKTQIKKHLIEEEEKILNLKVEVLE